MCRHAYLTNYSKRPKRCQLKRISPHQVLRLPLPHRSYETENRALKRYMCQPAPDYRYWDLLRALCTSGFVWLHAPAPRLKILGEPPRRTINSGIDISPCAIAKPLFHFHENIASCNSRVTLKPRRSIRYTAPLMINMQSRWSK